MFCEIRNFTPLSESMPATDLVALLNELFTDLGGIFWPKTEPSQIHRRRDHGVLERADSVRASPHARPEASFRMRESLRRFNQTPERHPTAKGPVNRRLYSGGRRARAARAAHGDRTRKHRGHCADRICPSAVYHWSRDRRAQPVVGGRTILVAGVLQYPITLLFGFIVVNGANNHGTCRSSGRHAACAIQYIPKGDTAPEAPPPVNIVNIREDGPYGFRAPLEIGGEMIGFRATLCRCGASNNKPFCDGSHKGIGFRATGEPETRKSEALEVRDGPLEIQPPKNGPLQVTGNLEICAGTNRNVDRVTSVRLCRCGGSKTKPFCDNTHLKIGFKSD